MERGPLLALMGVLAAIALGACGEKDEPLGDEGDARPLTLALDFTPNAVHAGIYMTLERDLAADRGIELEVRAPSSSTDSLKLLQGRRADVAVVDIHDLGLARQEGADVVAFAALVQRPLAAVIADGALRRPRQLEGRRVGVTGLPSDEAVLRAVVEADGGDLDDVRTTTIGFSAVPALASGRVAAVTAFWNAEGVALRERGVRTREFRVDRYGAPPYPELVLVARRETVEGDRRLLEDLSAALAEGTSAAIADPDAAVTAIAQASDADPALVRAQLDAVAPALEPPLVLDRPALVRWARFDVRFGILEELPDVSETFDFRIARAAAAGAGPARP